MYTKAAAAIKKAGRVAAFTGAGISVESGIPPFRGENGLWTQYDPVFIEINYFHRHRLESWRLIREIFYDFFGKAEPNAAHKALAVMEQKGLLHAVITQNIDNLHQAAGSKVVHEFHGTASILACLKCRAKYPVSEIVWEELPPVCPGCGNSLKPDFVFFGEPIPEPANSNSIREAEISEVLILIGTSGEVMPAARIPYLAKQKGAVIIEVNIEPTIYTGKLTDIFLPGKATEVMKRLLEMLAPASPAL